MNTKRANFQVVTITLNPAIDRTVTISNFTAGAVNRVESIRSNPGGKGVNVASALADHGHGVAVTGFLGRSNAGAFEELFSAKKIADHFVRITGQTRIGIKITDPVLVETTDINFPGPAPTVEEVAMLRSQIAALDAAWFVVAGSLPPGVDPGIYRDIIADLRRRGRKVLLDTSGDPFPLALEAKPTAIKPNIHEFEAYVGRSLPNENEVVAAARELIGRGLELVVVSMGKEGACFVTANESVVARPPDIEMKSTVGAGDAMVAGILSAHLQKLPLRECARLATAFSIDSLSRLESGLSSPSAIETAMQKVTIA
jgi:1-phosphofructokinase